VAQGGAIVLAGEELPTYTLPGGMQLTLLSPSPEKLTTLASKWETEIKALHLTPGKAADFEKFLGKTVSKSTNVEALADAKFTADMAANNGSSIAVLAEYQGKNALLAADAHAPLLVASIRKLLKQRGAKKLKLDAFKVPHHASPNNLNVELMQLLDCKNYLISTNGDHFNHPDREAIGRVIRYGGEQPRLWFNYRTDCLFDSDNAVGDARGIHHLATSRARVDGHLVSTPNRGFPARRYSRMLEAR
jgi:hypothetical protein